MNGASCRSMSMRLPPRGRSRCCCGPARRHRATKSAAICAAWCAASAAIGRDTRLTIRGDGHYGRPEVMAWCEANDVDFIFGLPGNAVLSRLVEIAADDVRVRRAEAEARVVRRYTETRYGAKSWGCERRVAARIEATRTGAGHPLRGHQPARRQRRVALRHVVLRTRTGREPDQAAQEPACLRPHQLPLPTRQSDAAGAAHRRLLADARGPRRHPQHRTRWPLPSSPPCACACSRSPRASARPQPACASPSPQPAHKPHFSVASRSASSPPAHNAWGDRPELTRSRQPQHLYNPGPKSRCEGRHGNLCPAAQAATQSRRPE